MNFPLLQDNTTLSGRKDISINQLAFWITTFLDFLQSLPVIWSLKILTNDTIYPFRYRVTRSNESVYEFVSRKCFAVILPVWRPEFVARKFAEKNPENVNIKDAAKKAWMYLPPHNLVTFSRQMHALIVSRSRLVHVCNRVPLLATSSAPFLAVFVCKRVDRNLVTKIKRP